MDSFNSDGRSWLSNSHFRGIALLILILILILILEYSNARILEYSNIRILYGNRNGNHGKPNISMGMGNQDFHGNDLDGNGKWGVLQELLGWDHGNDIRTGTGSIPIPVNMREYISPREFPEDCLGISYGTSCRMSTAREYRPEHQNIRATPVGSYIHATPVRTTYKNSSRILSRASHVRDLGTSLLIGSSVSSSLPQKKDILGPFLTVGFVSRNGLFRLKPKSGFLTQSKRAFSTKLFSTEFPDWGIQSKNLTLSTGSATRKTHSKKFTPVFF